MSIQSYRIPGAEEEIEDVDSGASSVIRMRCLGHPFDHDCFQELVQPEQVQICRDKKYFQMGPNPLSPIALRAVV